MRIVVMEDNGHEVMTYSTDPDRECLFPGNADLPRVKAALQEMVHFIGRAQESEDGEENH